MSRNKSSQKDSATASDAERVQAKPSWKKRFWRFAFKASLVFLVWYLVFIIYCDSIIQGKFTKNRWQVPATVYAQPLEIIDGKHLAPARLKQELQLLGYRKVIKAARAGDYEQYQDSFIIYVRDSQLWEGKTAAHKIAVEINNGKVSHLRNHTTAQSLSMARLEPLVVAHIYPQLKEDRVLVKLDQVPEHFKRALLATEDRDFYDHFGVSIKGIMRALWSNLSSDKGTQGGSTLTQQLVKNYFLSNEQTYWRKFVEANMALILEARYEKDEILQAYLNEVFFGQDGERAIHGIGLAARYFFDTDVSNLKPAQSAMLVAILKGPSAYNPHQNPKKAQQRRNLVLGLMQKDGILTEEETKAEQAKTLSAVKKASLRLSKIPAFLDLVKRELSKGYSAQQLNSEGLQIYSTLDPVIQRYTEQAVAREIKTIEKNRGRKEGELQLASIITDVHNGQILALVGDRQPNFKGFNRALDAKRQIGSLIKPFVLLAALEKGGVTLGSIISDSGISRKQKDGSTWRPKNYDGISHGKDIDSAKNGVLVSEAITKSYNLATIRLALQTGLDDVVDLLDRFEIPVIFRELDALPLGIAEMSPLQVTQMYQSLANGGLNIKPSAVIGVTSPQGELLQRYPIAAESIADRLNVYLVKSNLVQVVEKGTARRLKQTIPFSKFAGKTGTTNEAKDSWFAGFSGEHLGVVWVGRDDNNAANVTGATAALPLFIKIFEGIDTETLELGFEESIEWHLVSDDGRLVDGDCENVSELPFIVGTKPTETKECGFFDFWSSDDDESE